MFWGYRRTDDEPTFFRPSIALLLDDIKGAIVREASSVVIVEELSFATQ